MKTFQVETPHDKISASSAQPAAFSFAVTNMSDAPVQTGFRLKTGGDVNEQWCAFDGTEREIEPRQTVNLEFTVTPPAGSTGAGKLELQVYSVKNPDSEFATGPSVEIHAVPAAAPVAASAGGLRWALLAVLVLAVAGSAITLYYVFRDEETGTTAPADTTPPPVVAAFTTDVTEGLAPLEITFTDTSTGAPDKREWSFGSEEPLVTTETSVKHRFEQPGEYKVRLSVSRGGNEPAAAAAETGPGTANPGGASDGETGEADATALPAVETKGVFDFKEIVIKAIPRVQADFVAVPASGTAPLKVHFDNRSEPAAQIKSYTWDFGNDKTSDQKNVPDQTYTQPGSYDVVLVVEGEGGDNTHKVARKIEVSEPGSAAFEVDPSSKVMGDAPLVVKFKNKSVQAQTSHWEFGDGGASDAESPSYTFSRKGVWQVKLRITTNEKKVSTSAPLTVTVFDPPTAVLTGGDRTVVRASLVAFDYRFGGDTKHRSISLGDGTTRQLPASGKFIHRYNTVGTFPVSLTTVGAGGRQVQTRPIRVTVKPRTMDVTARGAFGPYFPRCTRGDKEFGGGPQIVASVAVGVEPGGVGLVASADLTAMETKKDRTTGAGKWRNRIYTPPAGWKVESLLDPATPVRLNYRADGYAPKVHNFPWCTVTIIGDTKGDDLIAKVGKTSIRAEIRNLRVRLVEIPPTVRAAPAGVRRIQGRVRAVPGVQVKKPR